MPETAASPTDLPKDSLGPDAQAHRAEFKDDNCTDWAAALTYYGVLATFPATIAAAS